MHRSASSVPSDPIRELGRWIDEARRQGIPEPASVAFITATPDGRPSARTVTLKRIEDDALVFTSALWTRKVREIELNPHVALVFHWPELGRQAQVAGTAAVADRRLAEELFAERDPEHRLQTIVSRQGDRIEPEDLDAMRARLVKLRDGTEEVDCPPDWGALRVTPTVIELWREAPDRLHERRVFERTAGGWSVELLSP